MKQKFLATLLTLALSVSTLMGCGGSGSSSPSTSANTSSSNYAVVNDTVDTSGGGITPEVPDEPYEGPTMLNDTDSSITESNITEDHGEQGLDASSENVGEEEVTTWDEATSETAANSGIEGIIVMQASWQGMSTFHLTVYAIDPVTGASKELNHFTYDNLREFEVDHIQPPWSYAISPFGNWYNVFSSDYTKVAAIKTFVGSGEDHAGWLDANGNFFDVTVALDEQAQDDFDEPAKHMTIGFYDDVFLYRTLDDRGRNFHYYGVDMNNIATGAFWEIDAADNMIMLSSDWYWLSNYEPTCWVDNDRVLVEASQNGRGDKKCRIATVSTKTLEVYLPGEDTHSNWSAVASPDGTKVAFFSQRLGGEEINMYIASMSGENPTKLQSDFTPSFTLGSGATPVNGGDFCYILEWR